MNIKKQVAYDDALKPFCDSLDGFLNDNTIIFIQVAIVDARTVVIGGNNPTRYDFLAINFEDNKPIIKKVSLTLDYYDREQYTLSLRLYYSFEVIKNSSDNKYCYFTIAKDNESLVKNIFTKPEASFKIDLIRNGKHFIKVNYKIDDFLIRFKLPLMISESILTEDEKTENYKKEKINLGVLIKKDHDRTLEYLNKEIEILNIKLKFENDQYKNLIGIFSEDERLYIELGGDNVH